MPRLNSPTTKFWIEPITARDLAAACQLDRTVGLGTQGEAGLQARLADPNTLFLVAFQQSDNEFSLTSSDNRDNVKSLSDDSDDSDDSDVRQLAGLFSGWVVVDELEIDNLVVGASARQQGIGRALLTEALQKAWQRGARYAFLEVRESNLAARSLYYSVGFTQFGRRRSYYNNPIEDALMLRLDLSQSTAKLKLRLS